tara:strand:- start:93 stop:479 length:387 start_codon:yes stop_codon:yes gene_type:complete
MNVPIESRGQLYRTFLKTTPNPNPKLDYLTELRKQISSTLSVTLTYIPDKLLLRPEAFIGYLEVALPALAEPYESFAHVFLEDVNNEVVPRWLRVVVISEKIPTRRIVLIDSQPKWNNASILALLSSR